METTQVLGLDEALITVNKTTIQAPLDVYYQIDECFGCPLDKLTTISENVANFIMTTKYKLQLELRDSQSRVTLCRFSNLEFNNHGHYGIDLTSVNSSSKCSVETLEKGECSLCPIALLICFLILVTICEKVYSKFVTSRNSKIRRASESTDDGNLEDRSIVVTVEEQQQIASNNTESNTVNEQEQEQNNGLEEEGERETNGQEEKRVQNQRVDSLDAFRGLTITGMILVNYGGAGYVYLEHKAWNGLTPADLVFPFFIFSMGASIAISTRSMVKQGKRFPQMMLKIFRRSFLLLALGLCLNSRWLEGRSLHYLRITGVLQRFSISYFIVALMYSTEIIIENWIRAQSLYKIPMLSKLIGALFELITAFNFLAIYVYVTFIFEYDSNCPVGYTGPGGQTEAGSWEKCTGGAAAWLDRKVLGESHLYNDTGLQKIFKTKLTHDPEGILGYTTSILLTLIGLQCGKILLQSRVHRTRLLMFTQWIALLLLACPLVTLIPINKRLWSLTFILLMGAFSYLTIATLYLLMDVFQCQRTFFLRLLVSAGKNSIFLYVGHSLLYGMLPWYFVVDETSHLQLLLRLAWSTFVWLLCAHFLANKRLFIKL